MSPFCNTDFTFRYGSSYLLTTTALQPSFGKVYTYFDVKFTYLIVIVIFEVGSILCAGMTKPHHFFLLTHQDSALSNAHFRISLGRSIADFMAFTAAKNSVMLIIGRAVAGAGAAGIFSGGMTIIGFSVPLSKRPIYLAAVSSMFG